MRNSITCIKDQISCRFYDSSNCSFNDLCRSSKWRKWDLVEFIVPFPCIPGWGKSFPKSIICVFCYSCHIWSYIYYALCPINYSSNTSSYNSRSYPNSVSYKSFRTFPKSHFSLVKKDKNQISFYFSSSSGSSIFAKYSSWNSSKTPAKNSS